MIERSSLAYFHYIQIFIIHPPLHFPALALLFTFSPLCPTVLIAEIYVNTILICVRPTAIDDRCLLVGSVPGRIHSVPCGLS